MATKTLGRKLDTTETTVDNALSCAAGGSWVSGSSIDCQAPGGAGTPDADEGVDHLALTNAGSTNGYDLDVIRQWSIDNSTWPASGSGDVMTNFKSTTAGADLSRSGAYPFLIRARYSRLQYRNNNVTDAVTVTRKTLLHTGAYET